MEELMEILIDSPDAHESTLDYPCVYSSAFEPGVSSVTAGSLVY